MTRPLLFCLFVFSVILVSGCVQQPQGQVGHFNYTIDNRTYTAISYGEMAPAIRWIAENTPQDAIIMAWWDYGHMVRGQAGRETVVYEPSHEILGTVAMYARLSEEELAEIDCKDCSPHERISDVATAIVTEDPAITKGIMEKYGAGYVLVRTEDESKLYALLLAAGMEPSAYLDEQNKPKNAQNFILFRMTNLEQIPGLELSYQDETTIIYKKS